MKKVIGSFISLLSVLLLISGCAKNEPVSVKQLSAGDALQEGWKAFEEGSYRDAVNYFTQAVNGAPNLAEAYQGLGWSYARLDSLPQAVSNFNISVVIDSSLIDSYAGHAFVSFQLNDFGSAIASANRVLNKVGNYYTFKHDHTVSWRDLRLLLAQGYFELTNYPTAQAQIDILLPDNKLDPRSENYIEQLSQTIESLNGKV